MLGSGALCFIAQAQYEKSPLPKPTGWVNDYANVINPATKQRLEILLTNLKSRADIEFAVVTVPTTGETPIFDYTIAVARGWGIGARDGEKKSLILLIAVNDRKYQIQVSRQLEGDLPDGLVGEIGRRMREPFRANNYSDGIELAVGTLVATLAEKRGFSLEGIDQNLAYRRTNTAVSPPQAAGGLSLGTCCLIAFVLLILMLMFSRRGGGGGGGGFGSRSGGSGLANAILIGSVLNSMGGSRGGYGSGGSWSSGGDSSSGGFGGFGGGGDFGGGGAGGDW